MMVLKSKEFHNFNIYIPNKNNQLSNQIKSNELDLLK